MSSVSHAAIAPTRTLSIGAVVVLGFAAFDLTLEAALIFPALPALANHYSASLTAVVWLVTGFLLASAVAVPLVGRMGDVFGKRRMILFSLAAFALGSLICALTDSIGLAIAGRIIQGLGAAIGPLAYALVRDTVKPEELPRAIGVLVGASGAGGAAGFLLSGLLVDRFSPAAIFWLLFAVAVVLAASLLVLAPESPVRTHAGLDLSGAVALGSGLVLLLLAITKGNAWGWSSARVVALFAASAVLLSVFVLVERRTREPLLDLALLVERPLLAATCCIVVFGFTFPLKVLLIPQIAALPTESVYGLGLSTTGIGLILVPTGVAALVGGWAGGRTLDRFGPRALVGAGSALGIATYICLVFAHSTTLALATASAVGGFAAGLILTSIYAVVVRNAQPDKSAISVSVNVVARIVATAVGAQVAVSVITGAGLDGAFLSESGYTQVFMMGAAGSALLLLTSALLPRHTTLRRL